MKEWQTSRTGRIGSEVDPTVWTGRALQAESAEWQRLVLLFCIRPLRGADSSLAIMDIRARPISF